MFNLKPDYDIFDLNADLDEISSFMEVVLKSCESKEYLTEYYVLYHALKKQKELIEKINS